MAVSTPIVPDPSLADSPAEVPHLGAVGALASEARDLREKLAALEGETKSLKERLETVNTSLVDRMLDADCQRFAYGGTLFYLQRRHYASVRAAARDSLVPVLKDLGLAIFVREAVDEANLIEWFKEQREDECEIPEPIAAAISSFERVTVAVKKA